MEVLSLFMAVIDAVAATVDAMVETTVDAMMETTVDAMVEITVVAMVAATAVAGTGECLCGMSMIAPILQVHTIADHSSIRNRAV
jgi:hypothetical protein